METAFGKLAEAGVTLVSVDMASVFDLMTF